MGRMADILRNSERHPDARSGDPRAGTPALAEPPEVEAEEEAEVEAIADAVPFPELEDDDDVPFIEVGGPREPALRIVTPPPPPPPTLPPPPRNEITPTRAPVPDPTGPPPPAGPFTIAFQPVHAGRLPGRGFGPELIAYHQPDHPVGVQYRSLAAEIARQLPGAGPRVLLFTAAGAGAGTSTVLLNLAITLARQESTRVVAVDANAARPALAARLGVPAGPGLAEARAGVMPVAWCLQETAQPNLLALPAGDTPPRAGLSRSAVLDTLRGRADWVLLDAGAWPEPAEWADACDGIYLVLRRDEPAAALPEEILTRTGRLRGCVLTCG